MPQTTTLENLTEKVNENRKRQLCENIVKYQYFKTSEVMKTIDSAGLSQATFRNYIDAGISYINTGKKYRQFIGIYKYFDEALAKHIQPLTPRQDQKRVNKPYKRKPKEITKEQVLPAQNVVNKLYDKAIKVSCDRYAVQMDNNIRLCDSVEFAQAFKEGLSFMGCNSAKVVKIKIEEYV